MYIIGIDGGGTHTRVEIRDGDNRFLRRAEFGPFNMAAIGEDGFRERLREIFASVGGAAEAASVCVGGAGSSGGAMEAVLRQELEQAGFTGSLKLCGDHEIALAGAVEGPGLILIAGTGSVCCGRNGAGKFARCGGWGHLLDDGGSAYALGRDALSAALRTLDGRLPENALCHAVMTHLHAENAGDLIRFAYYESSGKTQIAALAPLVLETAADPVSRKILQTQAAQLQELAETVSRRLSLEHPPLALLGGLLEHDNPYSNLVREQLSPHFQLTLPKHDALWGAAELAATEK